MTTDLEVCVAFDGDEAGQRAATRAVDRLAPRPHWSRGIPRPDYELEAELEHWDRLSAEACIPATVRFCAEAIADIERELAERKRLAYRRAKVPHDYRAVLDQVKDRADLLAIFYSRAPDCMQRAGPWGSRRQVHVRCPFHVDDTPSLCIYVDEQRWWCFGACHAGGDAIDAVMLFDRLDFLPALLTLAREFGIEVPRYYDRPTPLTVWTPDA